LSPKPSNFSLTSPQTIEGFELKTAVFLFLLKND
jgi:hypothetical protein